MKWKDDEDRGLERGLEFEVFGIKFGNIYNWNLMRGHQERFWTAISIINYAKVNFHELIGLKGDLFKEKKWFKGGDKIKEKLRL